ncbi:MAG: peptide chain release factor 1 [Firmicutes bacterium]|nr:peptide chain release factor 1 [Bacillota bacterium]
MNEKLNEIERKFEGIEAQLASPEIFSDMENYKKLSRERKRLLPIIEKYREYKACSASIEASLEMLSCGDAEIEALAAAELESDRKKLDVLSGEIRVLLLPKDKNDDKNVLLEIRAGPGGDEAALFAAVLYRMYTMYSEKRGFDVKIVDENETELGGFKEITLLISGEGAYSRFKFESGVHRVQRVPETESQGRIHTSTATVAVLPEADETGDIEINPADITVETMKSSGAGGQHINKTESAIRIIHKPTGIIVGCQTERSQLQNKETALRMLKTKLYEIKENERISKIAADRKSQVGTGDRSQKIRTYNYPQSRVTDHRIGFTIYTLDAFLDGDIDGLIDALTEADTAERLKADGET